MLSVRTCSRCAHAIAGNVESRWCVPALEGLRDTHPAHQGGLWAGGMRSLGRAPRVAGPWRRSCGGGTRGGWGVPAAVIADEIAGVLSPPSTGTAVNRTRPRRTNASARTARARPPHDHRRGKLDRPGASTAVTSSAGLSFGGLGLWARSAIGLEGFDRTCAGPSDRVPGVSVERGPERATPTTPRTVTVWQRCVDGSLTHHTLAVEAFRSTGRNCTATGPSSAAVRRVTYCAARRPTQTIAWARAREHK